MPVVSQPTVAAGDPAPITRWGALKLRFERAVEKRWPIALFHVLNVLYVAFLGRAYGQVDPIIIILGAILYVIIFGTGHYLLLETPKQIKERAERSAELKWSRIGVEMETYAAAENFLASRLRLFQTATDPALIPGLIGLNIRKVPMINDALTKLCESLSAIAGKSLQIPLPQAWFRASYMEVQGAGDDEKLVYVGWHTLDGSPPRSMSLNKTYRKGDRCAGIAWKRDRPVIEDAFDDGHEWQDNYEGQGKNYKSMISVPVRKGHGNDMGTVIGVITVDTQIDRYFGKKNDRAQEDRIASMIQPYGTYIAFVSEMEQAISALWTSLGNPTAMSAVPQAAVSAGQIIAPKAPLALSPATQEFKSPHT